jgi:transposase
LLEKEPISKLCDEVGLQPTVFYRWQKEFFENGAAAFEQKLCWFSVKWRESTLR